MTFFRFVFGFLYTRNWYTGEHELSRPKTALFVAMIFIVLLGIVMVAILQAPVTYELS